MLKANENIEVSVNQAGQPTGFRWAGERYTVVSRPVRWFARREWWAESPRAYRGIGSNLLEVEIWRCQVRLERAGAGEVARQLELTRAADGWRLVRSRQ